MRHDTQCDETCRDHKAAKKLTVSLVEFWPTALFLPLVYDLPKVLCRHVRLFERVADDLPDFSIREGDDVFRESEGIHVGAEVGVWTRRVGLCDHLGPRAYVRLVDIFYSLLKTELVHARMRVTRVSSARR